MKGKTTGIVLILVSTIALSVGGYFLVKFVQDGIPQSRPDGPIEMPMDLDIPIYQNVKNPNIKKAVPNDDPSSYRIVAQDDLRFTYEDLAISSGLNGMVPSHGNPNIFLVPVQFRDLAQRDNMVWDERKLLELNGAFNGTNEDTTNSYNESVRSFYRKSSYGNLDLNFVLTDPLEPTISSDRFVSLESSADGGGTFSILEDFYAKGSINGYPINFNDKKYDLNRDGYIDGVWLIYNEERTQVKYQQRYWPYCYWYYKEQYNDPNFSAYANCSVNFTHIDSNQGLDAHTIIHETGHMLGLDDYYSYDLSGRRNAALGGLDMMDFNIGEHNAFSKTALGWTNPIVPLKPGEFKLRPFESTGDCIILANNFNDSAFSEYILLEYYTPTGLNEFDSKINYNGRPNYFSQPGIRAYHIDARICETKVDFNNDSLTPLSYIPSDFDTLPKLDHQHPYVYEVAHSNTRSRNKIKEGAYQKEDLIAAISADNQPIYDANVTSNHSLFKAGDKFTGFKYRKYFPNSNFIQNLFNDGSPNTFDFEVLSLTPEEATLKINFVNVEE